MDIATVVHNIEQCPEIMSSTCIVTTTQESSYFDVDFHRRGSVRSCSLDQWQLDVEQSFTT